MDWILVAVCLFVCRWWWSMIATNNAIGNRQKQAATRTIKYRLKNCCRRRRPGNASNCEMWQFQGREEEQRRKSDRHTIGLTSMGLLFRGNTFQIKSTARGFVKLHLFLYNYSFGCFQENDHRCCLAPPPSCVSRLASITQGQ